MVLYTMNREYTEFAIRRLENQNISYTIQEVGTKSICSSANRSVWRPYATLSLVR